MLDTIVPLIRKEAIQLGASKIENDLDSEAALKPDATDPMSLDTSSYINVSPVDVIEKREREPVSEEPPMKKQK